MVLWVASTTTYAQTKSFEHHYDQFQSLKNSDDPIDSLVRYHLNQAFLLIDSNTNDVRFGDVYYEMGKDAYQYSEHKLALNYFFQASEQFEFASDTCKYKNAIYNVGATLSTTGDNYAALKYYQEYANIPSCPLDDDELLLYHYNLALLFETMEQFDDASEHYQFIVDNNNQTDKGNYFSISSQIALSSYQFRKGDTLGAIQSHKRILKDPSISFYSFDIYHYGYKNLGTYYLSLNEFDSANIYFSRARAISDSMDFADYKFNDLLNYTDLYIQRKQYDLARMYGDSALFSARKTGYAGGELDALERLMKLYRRMGDWHSAFRCKSRHTNLKDSLQIEETKFSYLVSEIENKHRSNLKLDRNVKRANQKLKERNRTLLVFGFLVVTLVVLLFVAIRQRKRVRILNARLTELNKHKDKIIATLSHDVRTPLVGLEGIIELLKMDIVSKEEREKALESLDTSLANLKINVDALLSWSLSQLKNRDPKMSQLMVTEVFEEAISFVEVKARLKSISWVSKVDPTDLRLHVDKGHIQVILRNLLSNAVRFSHNNSNITLSGSADNTHVIIKVIDVGKGIPKDKFHLILGDEIYTESSDNEGFGLGLRLVKEYVNLNKGSISFESEIEKGTTFTIRFPYN